MKLTPERWKRIKTLTLEVLERAPDRRREYLLTACPDDHTLRSEVEALLDEDQARLDFLDPPIPNSPAVVVAGFTEPTYLGRTIGPYRLIDVLGSGGMGTVYRAEGIGGRTEEPIAVKLIHPTAADPDMVRRFRRERRALESLRHPSITRLIDAGVTEEGLPFLVMELVEGLPVVQYCSANELSLDERLRLFLSVCAAVQYAHQRLVVHCDLKPSNILVVNDGSPKLLDFGLARLLTPAVNPNLRTTTSLTGRGLTPSYASPEQIRGETLTTATDGYSLGVVLYEMVTGVLPYEFKNKSGFEQERTICETDPPAPSLAVARCGPHRRGGAHGGVEIPEERRGRRQLRNRLLGDLDAIILKALEKDPQARYPSINEFAADIRRYLDGLSVSARKGTGLYRAKRFVRRNRGLVAIVLFGLLALSTGLTGLTIGLRRATSERNAAVAARADSEAVNEILRGVLAAANPYGSMGQVRILELLDDASAQVQARLSDRPSTEAAVRYGIADAYGLLWRWDLAIPHLERSLSLYRSLYGDEHPAVANCLNLLGFALSLQDNPAAIDLLRKALSIRLRLHGDASLPVAASKSCLGFALGKLGTCREFAEAERLLNEAIQIGRDSHASLRVAHSKFGLAVVYHRRGTKLEKAKTLFREAIALFDSWFPKRAADLAFCLLSYANLLQDVGDEAEEIQVRRRLLNLTPHDLNDEWVRSQTWRLAELEQQSGRDDEAVRLSRRVLALECDYLATLSPQAAGLWKRCSEAILNESIPDDLDGHVKAIVPLLTTIPDEERNRLSKRLTQITDSN